MDDLSVRSDREVAVAAARAGAAVLQSMYGMSGEQKFKFTADFATAADVAAEQAILEIIKATLTERSGLIAAK